MHISPELTPKLWEAAAQAVGLLSAAIPTLKVYLSKRRALQQEQQAFISLKAQELAALVQSHDAILKAHSAKMAVLTHGLATALIYLKDLKSVGELMTDTNQHLRLVDQHFRKRAQSGAVKSTVQELPENKLRVTEKKESK